MFEAWKARKDVAPILEKDLVNLYVDTSKVPGGAALQDSYPRSRNQGIPWFVILDADGKELADSNGPEGNIGCPNTDGEIEVWTGILKKIRLTLSDEDLETLRKSRIADREERKKKGR